MRPRIVAWNICWRKGWDSNPRYHCWHAGFQDQFLKPLGHPSVTEVIIPGFADLPKNSLLFWLTGCGTITLMKDTPVPVQQPGQTVSPSSSPISEPPPAPPAEPPQSPVSTSEPQVPEEPAPPAVPEPPVPPALEEEPLANQFVPESPEQPENADIQEIAWTASEFIAHAKSFGWYAALGLAAIAGAALIFLLTKDIVSAGVIITAALFLGIYAGHKPRELEYRLDNSGLSIGQKHFGYSQFRSFSVLPEGAFSSIVFMPLKRFAVPTTIYYAPEDENKIVNLLGERLPLEDGGHDAIDRLIHRIHF